MSVTLSSPRLASYQNQSCIRMQQAIAVGSASGHCLPGMVGRVGML